MGVKSLLTLAASQKRALACVFGRGHSFGCVPRGANAGGAGGRERELCLFDGAARRKIRKGATSTKVPNGKLVRGIGALIRKSSRGGLSRALELTDRSLRIHSCTVCQKSLVLCAVSQRHIRLEQPIHQLVFLILREGMNYRDQEKQADESASHECQSAEARAAL
ncbi:MAG: hypothetical protein H0U99_01560 [Chthoniobacterales bacterium]|nr:hypothetical protein [Chthoniobacterales bacterium]